MTTQNMIGRAYSATPTANFLASWDANKNLSAVGFIPGYDTTATGGGTTTLTVGSNQQQYFTGSTTQSLVMPVASTLVIGQYWSVINNSSGVVTIKSSGGNTILALPANSETVVTCILNSGTDATSWMTSPAVSGSGTVASGLINQLAWYAASGTAVSGLTIVNSAGLLTNGSGVPGWVAYTGTGAPMLNTSPKLITSLLDTNGNTLLGVINTASAVNYLSVLNNATGSAPGIVAAGTDSNITVSIASKGTGGVALSGFTDNSSASSGIVGEYISSNITSGSPNSLTTATLTNVTSISLTKGDWDVGGNVYGSFATTMTLLQGGISTTSATLPSGELTTYLNFASTSAIISSPVPGYKLSLAATTTVYLVIYGVGTGGSGACAGLLWARRRR